MTAEGGRDPSDGLRLLREELSTIEPSARLDGRMAKAFENLSERPGRQRRLVAIWAAAASVALVAGTVLIARLVRRAPPSSVVTESPWPAPPALVRVEATFGAAAAAHEIRTGQAERHYWVDVAIGDDGSIRIVRVIPATHAGDRGTP